MGAVIKVTALTEEFSYADYQSYYDNLAVPLFLVSNNKQLEIYSTDNQPQPVAGQQIVSLITIEQEDVSHVAQEKPVVIPQLPLTIEP